MKRPDRKKVKTEKPDGLKLRVGTPDKNTVAGAERRLAELEAEVQSQNENKPTLASAYPSLSDKSDDKPDSTRHNKTLVFASVLILSLILSKLPFSDFIFAPLNQFATMIHEMGHAIACVLTGGHVSAMTIVPDGMGHGGLTNSEGGIRFIHIQAGYLGTAIVGCLLVYFGQFKHLSRKILVAVGSVMFLATIFFMLPGLFSPLFLQAFLSLLWGLALSGATVYAGCKLKDSFANLALLFLAIYIALDSVRSIATVIMATIFATHIWSDATTMQDLYGMPAILWSFLWLMISAGMLSGTIWYSYFRKH